MQADVIDYDGLHTGKHREAQYTALWNILPKFVAIPSAALPIAILGAIGYVSNAVQTPGVILAIKAIFALVPAVCGLLSFLIAWRFPITEKIHRAILDGIARHERGEHAIDPLTNAIVPPPNASGVYEATGWFLDNFSPGELRRYLARGARSDPRCVARGGRVVRGLGRCRCGRGSPDARTQGRSGAIASLAVVTSASGATRCSARNSLRTLSRFGCSRVGYTFSAARTSRPRSSVKPAIRALVPPIAPARIIERFTLQ